jgi:hypothetical protein
MEMPVSLFFWLFAIALSIHVVEESTVGGGFVNMVKSQLWPDYNHKKFFWFNAICYIFFAVSIIVYELWAGAWIVLPLSFAWMLVTNGFWHVIGTAFSKRYSPGLITSPIYWILMYFLIRYGLLKDQIDMTDFVISIVVGSLVTVLMVGSMFAMGRKSKID